MHELPYIDEHSQPVAAPRDVVWAALLEMMRREMGAVSDSRNCRSARPQGADGSTRSVRTGATGAASRSLARLLGCDPLRGTAEFAGRLGDTLPGFRVAEVEVGRRLVLRGRHRFSDYELTFVLDDTQLRAVSHAAFPGVLGRLYRAAVIGSGAHRLVTRRMLREVVRATR